MSSGVPRDLTDNMLRDFLADTLEQLKLRTEEHEKASMEFDFSNLQKINILERRADDIREALERREDAKKEQLTSVPSINPERKSGASLGLTTQKREQFRGLVSEQIDEKRAVLMSIESSLGEKQLLLERTMSEITRLQDDLGLEASHLHGLEQTLESLG